MPTRVKNMCWLLGTYFLGKREEQGHVGALLATQRTRLAVEGRVEAEAVPAGGEHVRLLVLLDAVGDGIMTILNMQTERSESEWQ